jgi:hypothetical protein
MNIKYIPESDIRGLAGFYFLALFLWPLYLFVLPAIFYSCGYWTVLPMIFPGLFLFTWMGFLMHESWHKYVPNVNSGFFYTVFSLMLLSDPQLYNIIHKTHHGEVHSYNDAEFHPLGEIKSRGLRVLYSWLEVVFGIAFLVAAASLTVPRDPRFAGTYRLWKLVVSTAAWLAFYGALAFLSHSVFAIPLSMVTGVYIATFWSGSFFLHQSQLVEHGNLIVAGNFKQRNLQVRNLGHSGIIERLFLFLTHDDSREHVLHHSMTAVHTRPFPGVIPLPEKAIIITLPDYVRILGRMLTGKVDFLMQ